MKGLKEPTVQTSTGGSCLCNQAQQEKGTFQWLEIYLHDSAQQRENSQICPYPPPHFKRGARLPPHFKNCFVGPVYIVFIKQSITAIQNLRFEIYFRFSRIQTCRIFYFLWRLFAKHQTTSSQCWIFSSWSRSRKIRRLSISTFLVYCCHSNIDFTKTYILKNFNIQSIIGENFIAIRQG